MDGRKQVKDAHGERCGPALAELTLLAELNKEM
jgi:hypothetical protein